MLIFHSSMMVFLSDVDSSVLPNPPVPVEEVIILFLTPAAHHCHLLKVIVLPAVLNELPGSISPFQSGLAKIHGLNHLR